MKAVDQAEELRALMKEQKRTRVIAVTSGKGGVGKTNIATNMAIAYAQMGKSVILLDADLGLANVNVIMRLVPQYNLYHVIKNQKKISEIIMDTSYGVRLIAGASGFSKIANLSEEERSAFITELNTLSEADIIIIDTSAGVSKNVISFVGAADDVIVVTTVEPTAITDAYGMIKIIATEVDNRDMNLKLIVNRVSSPAEGRRIAEKMMSISAQFLNLKLEYLGFIYEDHNVTESILKQSPFLVNEPRSRASSCLKHIVARLEKTEMPKNGGLTAFIRKIFSREWE